jgi:glucose-1-phosphate thymidylyltransferase
MKVIIPTAGSGTRLRPHTFTSPKTLLHVAGRPILEYLLEPLLDLPNLSELIFIVGDKGEQICEYVETNYNLPTTYLWQDEQQGLGHAISLAKTRDNGESILILLGDKIFEGGYQKFVQNPYTVIGVKMGENPQGVGIVETEGEFITRLIEKPENPPTNLVIEGAYYIQNSELLFQCLDEIIERDIRTQDEYQLTDGLQLMLEYGERMKVAFINSLHCGTPDQLLTANRSILEKRAPQVYQFPNSVIIPPVFIGKDAVIEGAIIGPYASIGGGTRVVNTIIKDAIIHPNAEVRDVLIHRSIIGSDARICGNFHQFNIGSSAQIDL